MKVSIVIAAYNSARYLPDCLESLINQSYKNLEIICINDGSTDDTLNILRNYEAQDERVKVFSKENEGKGAASARNLGLNYVTGDYVLILDSDDFFEPEMIDELVKKAEETDADLIIYTARHYDDKFKQSGKILKRPQLKLAPNEDYFSWRDCPDYICQIADFVAWNKFFKRELIERENLRFDRIPISDDCYPSIIGACLAERIVVINKPYVNYRINTGSSQSNSHAKHPEAAYMATYSVVDRLKKIGVYGEIKRSYLNIALRVAQDYYDHMDSYQTFYDLHNTLLEEVFPRIDAINLKQSFFYDYRQWEWYDLITNNSPEEILFRIARSYGINMNTGILRFQFPNEVEKNENVVLVGKELAGKYWYAQNLLGEYCNIVCWVNAEDEIPENIKYDRIIVSK